MDGCNNGYGSGLCRFCAIDNAGIQIFSVLGLEQKLYVKIQLCQFPFKVTMNDTLPKFICYTCINKLNMFYEFYHSAIALQSKLQSLSLQQDRNVSIETQSNAKLNKEPESKKSTPEIFTIDLIKEEDEEPVKLKKPCLENKMDSSSVGKTSISTQLTRNPGSSASQFAMSCSSILSSSLKDSSTPNHSSMNQTSNRSNLVPPRPNIQATKIVSMDGISHSTKSMVSSTPNYSSMNPIPIHTNLVPPRGNTHVIKGVSTKGICNSTKSEVSSMPNHSSINQIPIHTNLVPPRGNTQVIKGVSMNEIYNSTKSEVGKSNGPQILGTIDITGPKETDDILTIDITGPDEANHKILKVFSLSQVPSNHQFQRPNPHSQQKEALRS